MPASRSDGASSTPTAEALGDATAPAAPAVAAAEGAPLAPSDVAAVMSPAQSLAPDGSSGGTAASASAAEAKPPAPPLATADTAPGTTGRPADAAGPTPSEPAAPADPAVDAEAGTVAPEPAGCGASARALSSCADTSAARSCQYTARRGRSHRSRSTDAGLPPSTAQKLGGLPPAIRAVAVADAGAEAEATTAARLWLLLCEDAVASPMAERSLLARLSRQPYAARKAGGCAPENSDVAGHVAAGCGGGIAAAAAGATAVDAAADEALVEPAGV